MSFLDGLGAFGAGLSTFAGNALKDEVGRTPERRPLLNSTPSAPAEAAPEAAPEKATASVAGVPAEYMPFYEAASKRTGIPIDVLVAQAKQESGFRADAVGGAGEIGLHQILPSTARDPGYGMRGVDPASLRDPAANIAFAADYLKARAGQGADFSNPTAVNAALASYNGGGDPNYVKNVRRYMVADAGNQGQSTDSPWVQNLKRLVQPEIDPRSLLNPRYKNTDPGLNRLGPRMGNEVQT